MAINFIVYGQPVGKARPRVTRSGHAYTPERTREYESKVKTEYLSKYGTGKGYMAGVPLEVNLQLYYQIPKGTSKVKRERMINGEIRPTVKPDTDNVIKCILDALNGIAYADDNQIVEVNCRKWYSDDPCAKVLIYSI